MTRARWGLRAINYIGGIGLAIGLIYLTVHGLAATTWSQVGSVLAGVPLGLLVALAVLWLLGLLAHTVTLTSALPSLTHRRALTLSLTGSAVANTMPLGGAAGVGLNYRMLRRWGYSPREFGTYTTVSNVWDVLTKLLIAAIAVPFLGLPLLVGTGYSVPVLAIGVGIPAIAVGLVVAVMVSERAASRVAHWCEVLAGRLPRSIRRLLPEQPGELLLGLHASCRGVVSRNWRRLSAGMVLYSLLLLALLAACLAVTGSTLPLGVVVGGFVVERVATMVGLTPGGAGLVEVVLVAALVGLGASATDVLPGVLLYRALTFGLEIPVGGALLVGWLVSGRRRTLAEAG